MMNFVKIEGGEFQISTEYYFKNDVPVKKRIIRLRSFFIMDFVLEQEDWAETMGNNPSFFKGMNLPVECITWYDAVDFCNKRSLAEGLAPCYEMRDGCIACDFNTNGYRLPTEAEWEYAARGGNKSRGYVFSGGDLLDEVAWYAKNSGRTTHAKGFKKPNELGLYDMCGNVFEWCWDWYDKYGDTYEENPTGPSKGKKRIARGNCWVNSPSVSNLERRVARDPYCANHHLGVRLARSFV